MSELELGIDQQIIGGSPKTGKDHLDINFIIVNQNSMDSEFINGERDRFVALINASAATNLETSLPNYSIIHTIRFRLI